MTAPFVTTLGVRPDIIQLADEPLGGASPNTRNNRLTLRVHGAEVWDAVQVQATEETLVLRVKQAALTVLMPDVSEPDAFVVKLRGNEIRDESLSLSAAGVKNGSTLLVMSRRRHAVR